MANEYESIKTKAQLDELKLSYTMREVRDKWNANMDELDDRADATDAKFEAMEPIVEDAVTYGAQTKTDAQKEQARTNIGAGTYSKPSGGIPASDLAESYYLASNPNGYQANVIEGVQLNGSDLTVTNKKVNVQAVTSVGATSGSGIAIGGTSTAPTVGIDSSHKLPTTTEYDALATKTYVDTAIDNMPEPMIFKGTLGTGGTITSLPTAAASNEGYVYKVITAGTYASQSAKVGDTFICAKTGTSTYEWVLVPSGDDVEDTWRNIKVNGTELLGNAITTGAVNFKNGGRITVTGSGNDITLGVASGYSIPSTDDQTSWSSAVTDVSNKMDKGNPTGSGYVSINRATNSTVGSLSVSMGYANTASGNYSFATGESTTASGVLSRAGGKYSTAAGYCSIADGFFVQTDKNYQHAFGIGNVRDTENDPLSKGTNYGRYVEMVGNGTYINNSISRSNARTLDWNGNEKLAGDITLGNHTTLHNGASSDITLNLPTSSGTLALTSNITKSAVGLSNVANERQYSANNPPPYPVTSVNGQTGAITGLATETYVDNAVGAIDTKKAFTFTATDARWSSQADVDGMFVCTFNSSNTTGFKTSYIPLSCFNSNNEQVVATLAFDHTSGSECVKIKSDTKFAGTIYMI